MALQEEFEASGNWLFRWRGQLPLILVAICLAALRQYEYPGHSETWDAVWEVVCLLVSFIGLAIRVFTVGHTPQRTSGRNTREQVADTLNTTGIYSVVRHPLYLGNFFMGLGVALFAHLWWLTLIYVLAFWVYYERIMYAEEAFLRKKFGEAYLRWAAATPAFIPRFRNYVTPDYPFSVRKVLKKEYDGLLQVIVLLFLFEVAGDLVVERKFEVDTYWMVLLGGAIVVWAILVVLKKKTTLLNEAGR